MTTWTDFYGRKWPACGCLKAWLTAYQSELLRRHLIRECIDVYQLIGNAQASAGVHSKGGCYDIAQRSDEHVWVARQMGAAGWTRGPKQGFRVLHQHGALKGCPHMVANAKGQVADLEVGGDGLADGHAHDDYGPREGVRWPLRTWKQGIEWAKAQATESEDDMGCEAGSTPTTANAHQLLNLTNWKLTLPIGPSEDPTEVEQPALATYSHPTYFHLTPAKTATVFRAHCGGTTTSGSDYPRSELREMVNDGADPAAWNMATGTHTMVIDQAITHVPPNKSEVVAGQIHDASDDVIRILYDEGQLGVSWDDGAEFEVLDPAYTLGLKHKLVVIASAAGIYVKYGVTGRATVTKHVPVVTSSNYFKAGCYTISNTSFDKASEYGEVHVYALSVRHA